MMNLCCPGKRAAGALVLAVVAIMQSGASAQLIDALRIGSSFSLAVYITHAPGEPYFIYIVQKAGLIRRMDLRTGVLNDFIDLDPVVFDVTSSGDERGLLGLAFHPEYDINGFFFVYYSSNGGNEILARYQRAAPGMADPSSAEVVLAFAPSALNHNGGWIGFAPGDTDGQLYVNVGDSGGNGQNGQLLTSLFGKIHRLDVDGADNIPGNSDDDGFPADPNRLYTIPADNPFVGIGGEDEIWHYGLRNPWRASFDRETGAYYVGDVGESVMEEVNYIPAGAPGGRNFGWNCYEGTNPRTNCQPPPSNLFFPWFVYTRQFGVSVVSGYVYRGCAIPGLIGTYFFCDAFATRVWAATGASADAPPTGTPTEIQGDLTPPIGGGSISFIVSFGEDAFGEHYLIQHAATAGSIFRIVPQGNPDQDCDNNNVADCGEIALGLAADCDKNGLIDSCQIAANPALDCNSNSVLDTCEICLGDSDLDGDADFGDIGITLSAFGASYGTCLVGPGDADHDGDVDFADVGATLAAFGTNCS